MIPSSLRIYAIPLTAPAEYRRRFVFSPASVERWRADYGLDFSNYVEFSANRSFKASLNSYFLRDWPKFCRPIKLLEIDLINQLMPNLEGEHEFIADQDGELNAVAVVFEADLAPGVTLSVLPDRASEENSWANLLWFPGESFRVQRGQRLCLKHSPGAKRDLILALTPLEK